MRQMLSPLIAQVPSRLAVALGSATVAACVALPVHANVALPSIPLQAGTALPPNIMFLLDDSGSMQFEIMPDERIPGSSRNVYYLYPPPNNLYGGANYTDGNGRSRVLAENTSLHNVLLRSSRHNTTFYDPTITYTPWRRADGSSFPNASVTAARWNPSNSGPTTTINLRNQQTATATWFTCGNAADTSCSTTTSASYYPITYYVYKGTGSDSAVGSYVRYQFRDGALRRRDMAGTAETAVTSVTWGTVVRTADEEIQNFANWFTYYRSRALAARAGASQAFADLGSGYRVGFATINATTSIPHTRLTPTSAYLPLPTSGGFTGTNKSEFFTRLLDSPVPPQGTPLREALDWAGRYYQRTDDVGPWGPAPQLSCRRAYTIMTTDGYWSPSSYDLSHVGNSDNSTGPTYTDPEGRIGGYRTVARPYLDAFSGTLADIAMHYWKNDLRSDLTNNVPTSNDNPAFWQHMVTFGLSIGVQGLRNPSTDLPALTSGALSWPDPSGSDQRAKIDDLWHATVNSRGRFVAARNPSEFASGLVDALRTIQNRTASASNVSANSTQLNDGSRVYQAKFTVRNNEWLGELEAYPISSAGIAEEPQWRASTRMTSINPATRRVFSWNGTSGISFNWASLSAAQRTALGGATAGPPIVDYIRGDSSREYNGSTDPLRTLRPRTGRLGDIVNSSPAFNRDTNTIFVGANDGMLHAFDANSGDEIFAYVPGSVIPRLPNLASRDYLHEYFVDGEIVVSSRAQTSGNNYLVAALGRGGRGLFGLDVTQPSTFSATNVRWERTGDADPDMGYVLGEPVIAQANTGDWVVLVGNGYNSTNHRAVLYVIRMSDGTVISRLDTAEGSPVDTNGLATPAAFDADGNGTVDYVYAGDLHGNMWKFDLSGTSAASWSIGNMGAPLFRATNGTTRQPITAQPAVAVDSRAGSTTLGQRFVMFGTGRYLSTDDPDDSSVQSWYGLIDNGTPISSRAELRQRTIVQQGAIGGSTVRSFSTAEPGDMEGRRGWYVDFLPPSGAPEGERIVSASQVFNLARPTLIASSIIPEQGECTAQGRGFLNAIDPFTGAALTISIFDINNDNAFTSADTLGGLIVGSIDLGVGMPTKPVLVGNRLVVGGSRGELASIRVNLGGPARTGRISWREIVR